MENYINQLTIKQQLFCDEYLKDMNATRAALRAGYSAETAMNGSLMRKPKIKAHLEHIPPCLPKKLLLPEVQPLLE